MVVCLVPVKGGRWHVILVAVYTIENTNFLKKNNQLLYAEFFPFIFHLYTTNLYYIFFDMKKVYIYH